MESPHYIKIRLGKYGIETKNNKLIIIPKIEKYIKYMLTILLKLPCTEKFGIGTEIKTSCMKERYIYMVNIKSLKYMNQKKE